MLSIKLVGSLFFLISFFDNLLEDIIVDKIWIFLIVVVGVMGKKNFEKKYLVVISLILLFYCYEMILSMNDSEKYNTVYFGVSLVLILILTFVYVLYHLKKIFFIKSELLKIFFYWFLCVLMVNVLVPTGVSSQNIICLNLLIPVLVFFYLYLVFNNNDYFSLYLKIISFFTIALVYVYYNEFNASNLLYDDGKALNIVYFPLLLLPSVVCLKNKYIRSFLVFLIAAAVFSSMKRGGLISFFISLAVFYIIDELIVKAKEVQVKKILYIFLILIVSWNSFVLYDQYNDGVFMGRLETINEDKGSGREGIYEEVFGLIGKSDFIDFIFGHGDSAVSRDTYLRLSAHNDFLEVMYSYGFISLLVYVLLHINLIKTIIKLIKIKSRFAAPFALSYVQFFIFSLISHVVIYSYFVLLTAFWAMVVGTTDRELQNKIA